MVTLVISEEMNMRAQISFQDSDFVFRHTLSEVGLTGLVLIVYRNVHCIFQDSQWENGLFLQYIVLEKSPNPLQENKIRALTQATHKNQLKMN